MQGQAIKLEESDLRVGMALEMDAIRLQAQLDGINRAARLLAEEMYTKYGIDREDYQLSNWLIGFEPVGQPFAFEPAVDAGATGQKGGD